MAKTKNEKLQEKLSLKRKSSWQKYLQKTIFSFTDKYMDFLNQSKTERLAIRNILKELEHNGFKDISKKQNKFYKVFKNKSIIAGIRGKKDTFRLVGAHVDSPRLDLKPSPLFEDSGLAILKSHYYGGIKKYHWVNTPLALHGVIFLKSGKKIEISIGEKDDEPRFIIPDLLPHLAKDQMERKAPKIVEGEELNILFGNIPIDDDKISEQVKFNILKKLNSDYGIIEEDFNCAELEFVPAGKAVNIGLDKSMIGSYGQDDRVCSFTLLQAILSVKNPTNTAIAMWVDKEEVGSMGDTGAKSFILKNFTEDFTEIFGIKTRPNKILEISKAISADVTAGMNPNYKDVNDPNNVSYLGKGVSVEKYGGGGGKYSTHDAHAEYMSELRLLLDKNKIAWQTGELGKIDIGGGGTIAQFISQYGMDCVDAGPCVLGMHSPCEVTSKVDIYSAYLLYKAFFIN